MLENLPWDEYFRDQLPPGLSYPVGRDKVEQELRAAGAHVGYLNLSSERSARPTEPGLLCDVRWYPDSGPRYRNRAARGGHIVMSWHAVPSAKRHEFESLIEQSLLRRSCEWAAAVKEKGNAWTSIEHSLIIAYGENGEITAHEA